MTSDSKDLSQRIERIQNAVRQFPTASASLNTATDQLSQSIGQVDAILKKFSLGVPTWVSFYEAVNHEAEYFYSEDIGYAKIGGKWGVAIRTTEWERDPGDKTVEEWLFNDSPRLLRVRAVEKIPELLEALLERADEMTEKIKKKTAQVDAFAAAINSAIAPEPKVKPAKAQKG